VKPRRTELHLLTGSYALDALDEPELEAFERHLARCGSCVTEVRGLRETAARLAIAAAVTPPPALQERVMATAYRTRQLPPLTSRLSPVTGRRSAAERDAGQAGRARPDGHGRRVRVRLSAAVAAVSLAAVAVLAVLQVRVQDQLDSARARQSAVAAVLGAPDASAGSGLAAGGGTVTVVLSRGRDEAVVTAAGMPALPGAEVYQLWLMGPGGTRSAGLLPAEQGGRTDPVLAAGISPGDRLGITVEPAGGTARPTTTPLLDMPMPA
jgi:anti-sigma-K factor RskA